jgi:hypothetical protein
MTQVRSVSLGVFAVASFLGGACAEELKLEGRSAQQECRSVVLQRCDTSVDLSLTNRQREAARQMEANRINHVFELDRIVIEADRPTLSIADTMGQRLSRPLVRQGEHSFAIGESAKCTCMNVCPPPPFGCCQCTNIVGSRLSQSPGWAPTRQ